MSQTLRGAIAHARNRSTTLSFAHATAVSDVVAFGLLRDIAGQIAADAGVQAVAETLSAKDEPTGEWDDLVAEAFAALADAGWATDRIALLAQILRVEQAVSILSGLGGQEGAEAVASVGPATVRWALRGRVEGVAHEVPLEAFSEFAGEQLADWLDFEARWTSA